MWLSWKNQTESHQLPVLPPSFEVEEGSLNTVVNINELGNINLIGNPDLRSITIESFFPNQDYPFVTTQKRHDPYVYVESIRRWKASKMPIRLVITDTPFNIAFAIENFTCGERDGSGDVYYVLELSEYVFTGTKKKADNGLKAPSKDSSKLTDAQLKNSAEVIDMLVNLYSGNNRDDRDVSESYIVKPGDTLTSIAKKATGNAGNYKAIAKKNNIKNPNSISVGQELKL